jgi:hypothetical protein
VHFSSPGGYDLILHSVLSGEYHAENWVLENPNELQALILRKLAYANSLL